MTNAKTREVQCFILDLTHLKSHVSFEFILMTSVSEWVMLRFVMFS